MLKQEFVEEAITLRRKATDDVWRGICAVLVSAHKGDTLEMIMARMPLSVNSDLLFLLRGCLSAHGSHDGENDWTRIGCYMEAAGAVCKQLDDSGEVELVWSGPQTGIIPVRRTDQVLYDIVHGASRSIILVTFAACKIDLLQGVLSEAVGRGVELKLILESEDESGGQLSVDALNAFAPWLRSVASIYYWPEELRERNPSGKPGKLHVKAAVVDDSALITSANLTEDAFSRNMEMVVLFTRGRVPSMVRSHLEQLISKGALRRHCV